jgi:ribonuclease P protein component
VRLGVSVSKKVSKQAVSRNRVRRRVYNIVKELSLKPSLYLFAAKPGAEKASVTALKEELKSLAKL